MYVLEQPFTIHGWLIGDGKPLARAEQHLTHGHCDREARFLLILRFDLLTELSWNEVFSCSISFDLI